MSQPHGIEAEGRSSIVIALLLSPSASLSRSCNIITGKVNMHRLHNLLMRDGDLLQTDQSQSVKQ